MNRRIFIGACSVGLAAIAWVGWGFIGNNAVALAMTAAIAVTFVLGAHELRTFRAQTRRLDDATAPSAAAVAGLDSWLQQLPDTLRMAVRRRVEGEPVALPGPAMAPFLVGLLVMLGMLGTFLGMVVTFKGAVFALEGSSDLQAIRAALAAPIRGLGLSFGTSVAGVAASAMLGLMTAIARRERHDSGRRLDAFIAATLRPHTLSHQRAQAYAAIASQAQLLPQLLPQLVQRLEAAMERLDARGNQLDEQLLARQAQFQRDASAAYASLAERVGTALQDSLAAGARAAGETLQPAVEATLDALARQGSAAIEGWQRTLDERAHALQQSLDRSLARLQSEQAQRDEQRLQAWTGALQDLSTQLRAQWEQLARESARAQGELAAALEHAGGQIAQRAGELRRQDDDAAAERVALLQRVDALAHALSETTSAQRRAVDELVASAATALERASAGFGETVQAQAAQASQAGAEAAAHAIEMSTLAQAFGQAVGQFQAGNDKLVDALQRIEASLVQGAARSDEQLAYYVAQAREVIDLSIASQQGFIDQLRHLRAAPGRVADTEELAA